MEAVRDDVSTKMNMIHKMSSSQTSPDTVQDYHGEFKRNRHIDCMLHSFREYTL